MSGESILYQFKDGNITPYTTTATLFRVTSVNPFEMVEHVGPATNFINFGQFNVVPTQEEILYSYHNGVYKEYSNLTNISFKQDGARYVLHEKTKPEVIVYSFSNTLGATVPYVVVVDRANNLSGVISGNSVYGTSSENFLVERIASNLYKVVNEVSLVQNVVSPKLHQITRPVISEDASFEYNWEGRPVVLSIRGEIQMFQNSTSTPNKYTIVNDSFVSPAESFYRVSDSLSSLYVDVTNALDIDGKRVSVPGFTKLLKRTSVEVEHTFTDVTEIENGVVVAQANTDYFRHT
jgi:hypothetical protein